VHVEYTDEREEHKPDPRSPYNDPEGGFQRRTGRQREGHHDEDRQPEEGAREIPEPPFHRLGPPRRLPLQSNPFPLPEYSIPKTPGHVLAPFPREEREQAGDRPARHRPSPDQHQQPRGIDVEKFCHPCDDGIVCAYQIAPDKEELERNPCTADQAPMRNPPSATPGMFQPKRVTAPRTGVPAWRWQASGAIGSRRARGP